MESTQPHLELPLWTACLLLTHSTVTFSLLQRCRIEIQLHLRSSFAISGTSLNLSEPQLASLSSGMSYRSLHMAARGIKWGDAGRADGISRCSVDGGSLDSSGVLPFLLWPVSW